MSRWTILLTADGITEYHAHTATVDASFARRQREFYEGRTAEDCDALAYQSWLCNEADGYQLARSYAALKRAI